MNSLPKNRMVGSVMFRPPITVTNWPVLHKLQPKFLSRIKSFLVFGEHGTECLLLTKQNQLYGFGEQKSWPSLGLGHRDPVLGEPSEIIDFDCSKRKIVDVAFGCRHVIVLSSDGQIRSWGDNRFGQLGSLNVFESARPLLVGMHIAKIRCGANHTLALTTTNQVFAWGRNNYGQIGIGNNHDQSLPIKVADLESFVITEIACGSSHSMALTQQGQLFAWGGNSFGQLGIGNCTHQTKPVEVKFAFKSSATKLTVKSMSCGENHSLVLMSNGEVYGFGRNDHGQLGQLNVPISEGSCQPVRLTSSIRFTTVFCHPLAAGNLSTAISIDGYCYLWGDLSGGTAVLASANDFEHSLMMVREPKQTPLASLVDVFACYGRRSRGIFQSGPMTPFLVNVDHEEQMRGGGFGKPNGLVDRVKRSFDDIGSSDLIFLVDERKIHAHKWFLKISSTYFNRLLADEWNNQRQISLPDSGKNIESPRIIKIHDYSYRVFYAYIRFLYTDHLELDHPQQSSSHEQISNDADFDSEADSCSNSSFCQSNNVEQELIEMLDLADCYLDAELKHRCIELMRQYLTVENCCHYYQLSQQYQLELLEQDCVLLAAENIFDICQTRTFRTMAEQLCKQFLMTVGESKSAI